MDIKEMHVRIEQETFHVDGLDPERIDQVLNDCILDFVRSKLPKKRNPFQEGIDDSVIAASDLDTLKVIRKWIGETSQDTYGIVNYNLPKDVLYPLGFETYSYYSISSKEADKDCPLKMFPGRIVDMEFLGELMTNSIQKSDYKSPAAVLSKNQLKVMLDKSFIIKGLYLSYLRLPNVVSLPLNQNCDLPETVHSQIVNKAIAYILENSESERLQTKTALNQQNA